MTVSLHVRKTNWSPQIELEDTTPPARRIPVLLHKLNGGKFNDVKMGYVVTHLPLEDWCKMNGYLRVNVYQGERLARPGERTELF